MTRPDHQLINLASLVVILASSIITSAHTPPSFTVQASTPAFVQPCDNLVLEAEHFHQNISPRSNHRWISDTDRAGYVGSSFMIPANNIGFAITDSSYPTTSPELRYNIQFGCPGRYYVWIRAWAVGNDSDSLHFGLDNLPQLSAYRLLVSPYNSWVWENSTFNNSTTPRAYLTVSSPGLHTLNVWMRDDGLRVDRILLSLNPDYTPSGPGPAESPRVGSSTPTSPTLPTATPTPRSSWNFDDNTTQGFSPTGGSWSATPDSSAPSSPNVYRVAADSTGSDVITLAASPRSTNLALSAKVKVTSDLTNSRSYVTIRSDSAGNNLYGLGIQQGTRLELWKRVSGNWVGPALASTAYPFQLNTWYTLRLQADGNVISGSLYSLSGTLLKSLQATDSTHSSGGYIGLRTRYSETRFDDVSVSSPSTTSVPTATPTPTSPPPASNTFPCTGPLCPRAAVELCGIPNFEWTIGNALARSAQPSDTSSTWTCLKNAGFDLIINQRESPDGLYTDAMNIAERDHVRTAGMTYVGEFANSSLTGRNYALFDNTTYEPSKLQAMMTEVVTALKQGKTILVHDAGGRGRMGLWEAAFMMWDGWTSQNAINRFDLFGWKINGVSGGGPSCPQTNDPEIGDPRAKGSNGQYQAIQLIAQDLGQPAHNPSPDTYGNSWANCSRPSYMSTWNYANITWPSGGNGHWTTTGTIPDRP